ncbi:MAG: glycosyltransferase [Hyphomicrobium sp.]|nr:glycosyltransferase [Hyphomicrobium sp.]
MASRQPVRQKVYLDLTHLGRHVTGIERISIEQFEKVTFAGADVEAIRSKGLADLLLKQQIWLPLLALMDRQAIFVFPGFPPSPLFRFFRERVVFYVHDLFLMTRKADLSRKARLYMAWPFARAVRHLKYFLTNSAKTRAELQAHAPSDSAIALYRPSVQNLFGLDPARRPPGSAPPAKLKIVMLGTLEPRKNYRAAMEILAALRRTDDPSAELHIIGREGWGGTKAEIEKTPGAILHGYLDLAAARDVIEDGDLFLCTSHDEGLGLPLLEVQFAGLPVVAPDQPIFREALGHSGIFIDPSDAEAAARTIAALAADRESMADASRRSLHNVEAWNRSAGEDLDRVRRLFEGPLGATLATAAACKAA